jgi:alkylhydroperoxidase family enzyme
MHDYTTASLDPAMRGMLDYAAKLTRDPGNMKESDVNELRALDLTDEQILAVVLITCMYNFMTRLADGLGVSVDDKYLKAIDSWVTGPARQWLVDSRPG